MSVKKEYVFRDHLFFSNLQLEEHSASHFNTVGFSLVPPWLGHFSMATAVFTAEKSTPRFRGNCRWKNVVRQLQFFGAFLVLFLTTTSETETFMQNPFCRTDPITIHLVLILPSLSGWNLR